MRLVLGEEVLDVFGGKDDDVWFCEFGERFVVGVVEGAFGVELFEEFAEDFAGIGRVIVGVDPEPRLSFVGLVGDGSNVEFVERLMFGFGAPDPSAAGVSKGCEGGCCFFQRDGVFTPEEDSISGIEVGEDGVSSISGEVDCRAVGVAVLHFGEEAVPIGEELHVFYYGLPEVFGGADNRKMELVNDCGGCGWGPRREFPRDAVVVGLGGFVAKEFNEGLGVLGVVRIDVEGGSVRKSRLDDEPDVV